MSGFPRVGDEFAGYRIRRELGRGGMGVVFVAEQMTLGREVALKVLLPHVADEPEYRARFVREASVLARLQSPHVIHVYEHGEHDGCLFIATQLVSGGDLAQRLQAGPLAPETALELAQQLAGALAEAHDAGIIHRDIKPSNVLVRAGHEHAYLCDFGIAHVGDGEITQPGSVVGSYASMAPERFQGAPASVASDIYGMGCLLWSMLTGAAPYAGTELELPMRHLQAPLPQLEGGTPADLAVNHILQRTLAKDPADRYPSAAELRADLRAVPSAAAATRLRPAVAEPTQARPPARTPFLDPGVPVSLPVAPQVVPPAASPRSGRGTGVVLLAVGLVAVLVVGLGGWLLTRDTDSDSGKPTASPTAKAQVAQPTKATTPTKRPVADAPAAAAGSTAVPGDLSGLGGAVLVSPAQGGGSTVRVRSVDPATFGQVISTSRLDAWPDGRGIVAGDFDGDGEGDLARLRQRSGGVAIEVARGTGSGFAEPDEWVFQSGWVASDMKLAVGDFDDNGSDDIASVGKPPAGGIDVQVFRSSGAGFRSAEQWAVRSDWTWSNMKIAAGRFDGGPDDVVELGRPTGGGVDFRVFSSEGSSFGDPTLWRLVRGWTWSDMKLVAGDFTGDGTTDIAEMGRPAQGGVDVVVLPSTGSEFEGKAQWFTDADLDWGDTTPVTVRGSGDGDAVVLVTLGSTNARMVRLEPDGAGGFQRAAEANLD